MSEQPPEAVVESTEDAAAILARIKPTKRQEWLQVCLRPDLVEEWVKADEALEAQIAQERKSERLAAPAGGSAEAKRLAQRVQELEQQMESPDATIWLLFEAMSNDAWQTLTEQHPPRKDNQIDQMVGYDRAATVDAAVRECIVKPTFTDESWNEFTAYLNPSEWEAMRESTQRVNGRVTGAPKSQLAATVLTPRAVGSKRPASGGSARESSTGGRRRKSTGTSTTSKGD